MFNLFNYLFGASISQIKFSLTSLSYTEGCSYLCCSWQFFFFFTCTSSWKHKLVSRWPYGKIDLEMSGRWKPGMGHRHVCLHSVRSCKVFYKHKTKGTVIDKFGFVFFKLRSKTEFPNFQICFKLEYVLLKVYFTRWLRSDYLSLLHLESFHWLQWDFT